MTWTAPQIPRQSTPTVAGERQLLEAWLDYHRQTLLSKCSGLTAEQLRQRPAPPSTMSLLGLVRHMADVERGWFRRRIAGEDIDFLYSSEADPDGEFDNVEGASEPTAGPFSDGIGRPGTKPGGVTGATGPPDARS